MASSDEVRAFNSSLPKASLKACMAMRYPSVPSVVKTSAWRPLALLNYFCPGGGYTVAAWQVSSHMQQWYAQFVDDGKQDYWLYIGGLNIMGIMAMPFLKSGEDWGFLCSGGLPRPEGCFFSPYPVPRMLCQVDFDNLPGAINLVLDRLVNYMELTGCCFGLVSCLTETWLCKWDDAARELLLSPPLDNPLMALGYLMEEARSGNRSSVAVTTRLLPKFDTSNALRMLQGVCKVQDDLLDPDRIVAETVIDDAGLLLGHLSQFQMLPLDRMKNRYETVVAMRGQYKGEEVVVKARDLTSPFEAGAYYGLTKFVREVDSYMRLRKLQGCAVPKLLSWGFVKGAMFVYVMMSDGGKNRLENMRDYEVGDPRRAAALPRALECLREIHKRGVLHNDLNISKIVTKLDGNAFSLKLVGFGDSKVVQVMSPEWFEATARETDQLKNLMEVIATDRPRKPRTKSMFS